MISKKGELFKYLCDQFLNLSEAKQNEDVFEGPDMAELLKGENIGTKVQINERKAQTSSN